MEGKTPVDAVCFPVPLDRQAVRTVAEAVATVADAIAVFKNIFRFTYYSSTELDSLRLGSLR